MKLEISICDYCGESRKEVAVEHAQIRMLAAGTLEVDVCDKHLKMLQGGNTVGGGSKRGAPRDATCEYCGQMFTSEGLQRHVDRMHPEHAPEKEMVECPVCHGMYSTHYINRHLDRKHADTSSVALAWDDDEEIGHDYYPPDANTPPNTCPECGRAYTYAGALVTHMRELHPDMPLAAADGR